MRVMYTIAIPAQIVSSCPDLEMKLKSTCLFSLIVLLTGPVVSAELIVHSEMPVKLEQRGTTCQIELSGEIEAGDAAALDAFLEQHNELLMGDPFWIQGGDGYDLCLKGPGGSYAEALKIVDVITDRKVGTMVPMDSECLSACAVVFMAGIVFIDADFSLRMLKPGARLGFHAPSINVPGSAAIPASMVKISYEAALRDISGVIDRLGVNSQWGTEARLPSGLLSRMMSTPPDEMFIVSTVNEAGMWDIGFDDGDNDSINLSEANLVQGCYNAGHWIDQRGTVSAANFGELYRYELVEDSRARENETVVYVEVQEGPYYKYCRFFVPDGLKRITDGSIRAEIISEESGREEMISLATWEYLNPEMTLDQAAERAK